MRRGGGIRAVPGRDEFALVLADSNAYALLAVWLALAARTARQRTHPSAGVAPAAAACVAALLTVIVPSRVDFAL